jgi:hypothetical protein
MSVALVRMEGMDALLDDLGDAVSRVRAIVAGAVGDGAIRSRPDADLVAALRLAGDLGRLADAMLVEATGEVDRRSRGAGRAERLSSRMGCHDVSELVQRATRLSPATVSRLRRGADAVCPDESILGEVLPPRLPAMRASLADGEVGLDGLLAVADPLAAMSRRVGRDDVLAADAVLAAEARGEGPDGAPPVCADLLRVQAQAWAAALDQDGAEPLESRALHRRGITLGRARDGGIPLAGLLLPEVAAQLQRILDAAGSPRVDGGPVAFRPADEREDDAPVDARRPAQRRHDAFATALFAAASSGLLPTIGGAAPTLVVSVRAEDLISGRGWAHVDGTRQAVPVAAARHAGCAGVVQRVLLDSGGRIERIGTEERVFNRHQRRAIALRDGGCVIPGCGIPAGWCEIHHVTEHAIGGPTHTDNGVLLCWFHHRHLDRDGWSIRMNRGVPEVRAPQWIDAHRRWRSVTTSPSRLRDRVIRRT